MRQLLACLLILFAPACLAQNQSAPAQAMTAASVPVPPTLDNVLKAMARLGAINLGDDRVLDDYARGVYCDIYQRYHADEFTWRKVRTAIRASVKLHVNEYPLTFRLDRPETLGQYDFSNSVLPLTGESVMSRTLYLILYSVSDNDMICGVQKFAALPARFVAVLNKPLQLNALPMSEAEAAAAVKDLEVKDNQRVAYGRFIVTLTSFLKVDRLAPVPQINVGAQFNVAGFYKDPAYETLFWRGTGTFTGRKVTGATPLDQIPFEGVTDSQIKPSTP